jgi:hypothetical protein
VHPLLPAAIAVPAATPGFGVPATPARVAIPRSDLRATATVIPADFVSRIDHPFLLRPSTSRPASRTSSRVYTLDEG